MLTRTLLGIFLFSLLNSSSISAQDTHSLPDANSIAQHLLKQYHLPEFRITDVKKIAQRYVKNMAEFEEIRLVEPVRYFTKWKSNQEGVANSLRPMLDQTGLDQLKKDLYEQRKKQADLHQTLTLTKATEEQICLEKTKISFF